MTTTRQIGVLTAAAFFLTGCSTSFTNMTPAKALEPLHGQVSVTAATTAHSAAFDKTINAPDSLSDSVNGFGSGEDLTEDQYIDVVEVGTAWLLFSPGGTVEVMGRIGVAEVLEGLDIGFRYNFDVVKGDAKLQVLETADGTMALSVQAGYGYHSGTVNVVQDYLQIAEWTRHDLDFMVSGGVSTGENFHFWVAPRVIVSLVDVEQALPPEFIARLPNSIQDSPNELIRDETMIYYGGTFGAMVGVAPVFFTAEITLMRLAWQPELFGRTADFDSFVIAPSAGFSVMW